MIKKEEDEEKDREEEEGEDEEELVDVVLVDSEDDGEDGSESGPQRDIIPPYLLLELSREFKKYYFDLWAAELRSQRPASTLEHLREWQRGMRDMEEWVQSEFASREYHFRERLEQSERLVASVQSLVQQQSAEIALLKSEIAELRRSNGKTEPADAREQDIVTSTELARQRIDIESRRLQPEAFQITFLVDDNHLDSNTQEQQPQHEKPEKKHAIVKTTRKNDMRTTTVTTKQGKTLCVARPR